jgi:hypothetical protein
LRRRPDYYKTVTQAQFMVISVNEHKSCTGTSLVKPKLLTEHLKDTDKLLAGF